MRLRQSMANLIDVRVNAASINNDLGIPKPAPDRKIILHAAAARKSTTNKVPAFCKCKDKRSWYSTRSCACVKADVKCKIACHGGGDKDNVECPNLDISHLRSQRSLRVRDRDDEGESSKRQQRGTVGKRVTSITQRR